MENIISENARCELEEIIKANPQMPDLLTEYKIQEEALVSYLGSKDFGLVEIIGFRQNCFSIRASVTGDPDVIATCDAHLINVAHRKRLTHLLVLEHTE